MTDIPPPPPPNSRRLLTYGALTVVVAASVSITALVIAARDIEVPATSEIAGEVTPELEHIDPEPTVEPARDNDAADDPPAEITDPEPATPSDEEFDSRIESESEVDYPALIESGMLPLATFPVDGSQLDTSEYNANIAATAQAVWDRFTTLIPEDQRQMVSGFDLLSEQFVGAFVYHDTDPTKWVLSISYGLGDYLDATLIHEFGHLLTLQATEVPPGDDTGSCATYFTGGGCALPGSTIAEFVARFWPESLRNQVSQLQETFDWDALDAFYNEHPDEFVTAYATRSPREDLAETFTVFVINDRPTDDTIADQKALFLWSDPDMVDLRDQIRSRL